jgi:hypothetical protein
MAEDRPLVDLLLVKCVHGCVRVDMLKDRLVTVTGLENDAACALSPTGPT